MKLDAKETSEAVKALMEESTRHTLASVCCTYEPRIALEVVIARGKVVCYEVYRDKEMIRNTNELDVAVKAFNNA